MGDAKAMARLGQVLESWEGTPYMSGQRCRGVGVDCVRFVVAVLDELTGRHTDIRTIPPDTCLHAPAKAREAAERLSLAFEADRVTDALEAGDVIVTGPVGGGPGHVMIVGHRKSEVWHASYPMVHKVGLRGVYLCGHQVFDVFRLRDRKWG